MHLRQLVFVYLKVIFTQKPLHAHSSTPTLITPTSIHPHLSTHPNPLIIHPTHIHTHIHTPIHICFLLRHTQSDLPHGEGTFTGADGSSYKGEYRTGKRHGAGALVFASGNRFDGSFENDAMEGHGEFTGKWRKERRKEDEKREEGVLRLERKTEKEKKVS